MSILVVGGDKIENIIQKLSENGFSDVHHISGRRPADKKFKIPYETDLVLVLVDFINHQLMNVIKKETRKNGVQVTFSKRSWVHIENNINNCIMQ